MTNNDYFRPLGFRTTFERVFQVFGDRWKAFLAISFVWYVLGWIFAILLNLVMGNDINIDGFSSGLNQNALVLLQVLDGSGSFARKLEETDDFNWDSYDWYNDDFEKNWESSAASPGGFAKDVFSLIEVLIYYVFTAVAHGAAIWIVAHWYLHQEPSLRDAFGVATSKCWTLVCTTLLLSMLASFLMVIPAMIVVFANLDGAAYFVAFLPVLVGICIFSILTYVTYVPVMVEGKSPPDSLQRSFGLTKGHFWKIFCIVFVWGIVKFLLGAIVTVCVIYGSSRNYYYFGKVLDTIVGILLLAIAPV